MLGLNRTRVPVSNQLPASAFPEPADVYLCDSCGRDITRYLHPGKAHSWQTVGPVRYVCRCGQKWLTGSAEWDYLGDWERRRRIRDSIMLSILFSAASSVLGAVVYLALHRWKGAAITAVVIVALPFVLIVGQFSLEVSASIWRTRFHKASSEK
jgi:hypothetical protein